MKINTEYSSMTSPNPFNCIDNVHDILNINNTITRIILSDLANNCNGVKIHPLTLKFIFNIEEFKKNIKIHEIIKHNFEEFHNNSYELLLNDFINKLTWDTTLLTRGPYKFILSIEDENDIKYPNLFNEIKKGNDIEWTIISNKLTLRDLKEVISRFMNLYEKIIDSNSLFESLYLHYEKLDDEGYIFEIMLFYT